MRICLIRHTAVDVPADICYGQLDVPLAADFDSCSDEVVAKLPPLDTVYTSTSQRCKKLADKIHAAHPLSQLIEDSRLLEFDYGDFEGESWESLGKQSAFFQWTNNWQSLPATNGESLSDLINRVAAFINELRVLSMRDDTVTAIVTHHGVIRSIIQIVLNMPLDSFFKMRFDYGAVVELNLAQECQLDQLILR